MPFNIYALRKKYINNKLPICSSTMLIQKVEVSKYKLTEAGKDTAFITFLGSYLCHPTGEPLPLLSKAKCEVLLMHHHHSPSRLTPCGFTVPTLQMRNGNSRGLERPHNIHCVTWLLHGKCNLNSTETQPYSKAQALKHHTAF